MPDVTITINTNHTSSISRSFLAIQGEQITVDVVVDAGIIALALDGYVDFLLPDGSSYFKGAYSCSTGTISFTLGALDSVLDKEGKVTLQFVLANTVGGVRENIWLSEECETKVLPAILATSSAILPYVPQMVLPVTYPAENITVVDINNIFTATLLEDILTELGQRVATTQTDSVQVSYPTVAEFNALLAKLKTAGLMA
jgi:hypothetical protein